MRKYGAIADHSPRTLGIFPRNFVMRQVRKIEEFCSFISDNENVFQRHGTARSGDNLQRAEAAGPRHLFLVSRNTLTSV
jgi:hypothetical protein